MKIFDGFFRNERKDPLTLITGNTIICDSYEIKKEITKWIEVEKWSFKDFAAFLELIGIKTPVRLSNYCESSSTTFKCITGTNKEILISLIYGDWIEEHSEIVVTAGQETRAYKININVKSGETMPSVILSSRSIKKDGKTLTSDYSEFSCYRTLKFDDNHMLKVQISEPYGGMFGKFDAAVLRNFNEVEDYLISLDKTLDAWEVYEKVIHLLDFSALEFLNSDRILISYIQITETEEKIRNQVLVQRGEVKEYAVTENGETFHRSKDGSWKYFSDKGIEMIFFKKEARYSFSMKGSETNLKKLNTTQLLKRINKKMYELKKFFE